jgi:hypothetical protein
MKKTYLKRKPLKATGFRSKLTVAKSSRPKRGKGTPKAKKPRKTKIQLWRNWLVPDGAKHRYVGLRGVYWYWLSRHIRKLEWDKWGGLCITCLEPIEDWRFADCGHIIPSSKCGEFLRFHPRNLTIQHKKCNNPRFTPEAGARNALHYDQRYGPGAWDTLWEMRRLSEKTPNTKRYEELIRSLPSYLEALDQHNANSSPDDDCHDHTTART